MTRDEIIRMAREAGGSLGGFGGTVSELERFAALVAAAEREACAKVCDPYTHGQWFADAIRARGNK
jgi:hypothetical protein